MVQWAEGTCRVCLRVSGELSELFEGAGASELRRRLEVLTRAPLRRHERLPRGVCATCSIELHRAHALLARCLAAETAFDSALESERDSSTPPALPTVVQESTEAECGGGGLACSSCGRRFARRRDVVVHQRTHTGEEPYACTHCPRRFKQVGALIRHERVHTGEKPFLCAACPKRFTDAGSLAAHGASHTDARPHACPLCPAALKTRNSWRKHVERHAAGRAHVCDRCGAGFALRGNLTTHMRRRHATVSERPP